MDRKCELLVPAGGPEQLIAAVENGADAVYIGGRLFNARMNAGNFDDETLRSAVDFAHQRGVSVHVTMNTLLRDDEIGEALKYAAFLYETGVDALIVADLGLGKRISEVIPDFPLHLSTQGTIYSLAGVEAAGRLGFERVVLARELSLQEIQTICENTAMEIEVFIHGALCICYSGQCQLSRYFGGRSGNRGQCAQPCRLGYRSLTDTGAEAPAPLYPLSPGDLCLIDHLGALVSAGVTSLKVEGRMKSADYVGVVTSVYRKYLDRVCAGKSGRVEPEDREALAQIFNRGGFTDAYIRGESGTELMSGDLPKHGGIYIGNVLRRVPGTDLLETKENLPVSLGDGVEIRGTELCGNVVTYCRKTKGKLHIGDIRGSVQPGDPIYRISSASQLAAVRKTYRHTGLDGGQEQRKTRVDIRIIGRGTCITAIGTHESGKRAEVHSGAFEPAAEPVDLERMEAALRKSGNTPFFIGRIRFDGDFGMRMKASQMNELRRRLLKEVADSLIVRRPKPEVRDFSFVQETQPRVMEYYFYTWERFLQSRNVLPSHDLPVVCVVPLVEYFRRFGEVGDGANIVPYVSNVTRGREETVLRENFTEICEICRETGVYVGNPGWIRPFRSAGIPVYGDYGLNVYNSQSQAALDMLGVRFSVQSLESDDRSNGAIPLMTLQHEPEGRYLVSERYGVLEKVERPWSDQTLLVARDADEPSEDRLPARDAGCEVFRYYWK